MKTSHLAAAAALALTSLLTTGCTTPSMERNHWEFDSVGPRVTHQFLGYQASEDGRYWERLRYDASGVGLTLRRHFLNDDPTNPMQPRSGKRTERPQPPNVTFTTHG